MNRRPSFPILLTAVILAGGLGGYLAGRPAASGIAPFKSAAAPSVRERFSLSPDSRDSRTHPAEQLRAWLERAESLAARPGLGFDPLWDTPGLLLSMEALTAEDFPSLLRLLSDRPDSGARKRLEEWLLAEWSLRRPLEALAWAGAHRPDQWTAALESLAKVNPSTAWEKLNTNPAPKLEQREMERVHGLIFETWARTDRPAALRALMELNKSLMGVEEVTTRGVAAGMAFWKAALPDHAKFPREWMEARDALTDAIIGVSEGRERISLLSSLMCEFKGGLAGTGEGEDEASAATYRTTVAEWIEKLPLDEADRTVLLQSLAQNDGCDAQKAPSAYAWLWEKVPAGQRAETLTYIVEHWAAEVPWSARDPDACGRWLNSLGPLGPEYAAGLKSFAEVAAVRDPVAGLAWARQITDPILKNEAVKSVTEVIRSQWPDRADALLGR